MTPEVSIGQTPENFDNMIEKSKNIRSIFQPQSVAVIGATPKPEKIGHQILKNIIEGGYKGRIYPVHPQADEILGCRVYASIKDIDDTVEFAVVVIPAEGVPEILKECGTKGVKAVAVISSGFAEAGNQELEERVRQIAAEYQMALVGPNIFGSVYSPSHLNASFGPREVLPGRIAFISQSGALTIAMMGWTVMEKIGLAALVSLGNKADVDETDLIEYFNQDPEVNVVVIYMEGVKNGRRFLRTRIEKPVVVLKVGRSERGARAAVSHTGSLAGSDKVFDGVFRQMGILRARSFTEAFGWSRTLLLPAPGQGAAVIITNGGGIGVRATDECEAVDIALLDDQAWLEEKFRPGLPSFGSARNPIDITGQTGAEGYRQALRTALNEDRVNAVLLLYCETVITDPVAIARVVEEEYDATDRCKPLVVVMLGGQDTRRALQALNEKKIPAFQAISEAVSALRAPFAWQTIRQRKDDGWDVPELPAAAREILDGVRVQGRSVLMEHESRRVFEACGLMTPPWAFVDSEEDAVRAAREKDLYPLALKVAAPDIIHKSDVGGVALNIHNEDELRATFRRVMQNARTKAPDAEVAGANLVKMVKGIECIAGLSQDPQFGPVVMFGLGGVFVEALRDVVFRTVPFGKAEAQRLLNEIKGKKVLQGFRGMVVDMPSLARTLCDVQMLADHVKEIDINPLMVNEQGSFAVDARIVL